MIVNPKSILIVNTRLIGDVLLTTPLIDIFTTVFPGVTIDFLVNRGTGEFLEKDPRVSRVIYSDKWKKAASGPASSYLFSLFRKYDLAITMNTGDRGAIAVLLGSRRYRVGYYDTTKPLSCFIRRLLYSHPVQFNEALHVVLCCRQIAEALDLPSRQLRVAIHWDDADRQQVSSLFVHDRPRPYMVIHPFARWRYKYWDIARFCEVSDRLAETHGLRPVWTSSPDKEEITLLIAAAERCRVRPLLIPGSLTLNQMACLLQGAALYVGLDTAITHIAASLGIPMVALYGPTELWRWHPWNNQNVSYESFNPGYRGRIRSGKMVTLQAGCEHQFCIRPHCYGAVENPCMMAISADEVFREADQLLMCVAAVNKPPEVSV